MSGSIGGVDASIPLRAGQGVAPVNPLATIGQFAGIQNQLNQAKLFPETLAQQRQRTLNDQRSGSYGLLAPMLAKPPDQWSHEEITNLLARGEHNGYVTQPILADLAAGPTGDGAALSAYLRPFIASQMQTAAESRLGAVTPTPSSISVGGQIIPTAISPAGAPFPAIPTQSTEGFTIGYSPSDRLATTTRAATQADVDASGGGITLGQQLTVPLTSVPATNGYNPGAGGARVPIQPGALGPGGYVAPQRPLTQLGAPYRPPGPPGSAAHVPGARLMRGPGGSFMVPPDKVSLFQQNGYQ